MTDTLEELLEKQEKEIKEVLTSTDDVSDKQDAPQDTPEEKKTDVDPVKEDWKDGYFDYEVKTKDSSRLTFDEKDIEIIEEDV